MNAELTLEPHAEPREDGGSARIDRVLRQFRAGGAPVIPIITGRYEAPRGPVDSSPLRVLLVDDEPAVLEFLVDMFTAQECLVSAASTAEEALDRLADRPFDLVVADIKLPGLSGLDLLRAASGMQPGIPVVLITGLPSVNSAIFGLRHGAYDYLRKPFSVREVQDLLWRVKEDRHREGGHASHSPGRPQEFAYQQLAMKGLFRIGELALQGPAAGGLLETMLDYTIQSFRGDAVLMLLRDHEGNFTPRQKGDPALVAQLLRLLRAGFDEVVRTDGTETVTLTNPGHPLAAVAALMPTAGGTTGILCLGRDAQAGAFLPTEKSLLLRYAQAMALALRNVLLEEHVESGVVDTIAFFVAVLESKDPSLQGHSARVSLYAGEIATAMGLSPAQIAVSRRAGLLHDLGKLVLLDAILLKPGPLTSEEYALVRRHPEIGGRILRRIPCLAPEAEAVIHHLERYDGAGFPARLKGEAIPLVARIVMVADAFDAMASPRPYRSPRALDVAVDEILRNAGSQFDPAVANAFASISRTRLAEIARYYDPLGRPTSEGMPGRMPRTEPGTPVDKASPRPEPPPEATPRETAADQPKANADVVVDTETARRNQARLNRSVVAEEGASQPPAPQPPDASDRQTVLVVARGHQDLFEELKALIGDEVGWVRVIEDRRADPTILPREGREGRVHVDREPDA